MDDVNILEYCTPIKLSFCVLERDSQLATVAVNSVAYSLVVWTIVWTLSCQSKLHCLVLWGDIRATHQATGRPLRQWPTIRRTLTLDAVSSLWVARTTAKGLVWCVELHQSNGCSETFRPDPGSGTLTILLWRFETTCSGFPPSSVLTTRHVSLSTNVSICFSQRRITTTNPASHCWLHVVIQATLQFIVILKSRELERESAVCAVLPDIRLRQHRPVSEPLKPAALLRQAYQLPGTASSYRRTLLAVGRASAWSPTRLGAWSPAIPSVYIATNWHRHSSWTSRTLLCGWYANLFLLPSGSYATTI